MFKGKLDFKFDALTGLLRPASPPLIGVDISSSAVKFVELEEAGRGQYRLERYVIEPLSKDSVVDGNIVNLDQVSDSFKRGWKKLNSRVRNVALALPTAAVITKKIAVPAGQREEELELQVETEANQYIPFALDEVNLDFQVLGPSPTSKDDVEVLIAASRKEKIEDRVAAAEAAGLKAVVVDIESHATQAAFDLIAQGLPDGGHDQTIAIVDVGTSEYPAQRRVSVPARTAVRRPATDAGDPAPLRSDRRGGRSSQAQRRPARELRVGGAPAIHGQPRARSVAGPPVLLYLQQIRQHRQAAAG